MWQCCSHPLSQWVFSGTRRCLHPQSLQLGCSAAGCYIAAPVAHKRALIDDRRGRIGGPTAVRQADCQSSTKLDRARTGVEIIVELELVIVKVREIQCLDEPGHNEETGAWAGALRPTSQTGGIHGRCVHIVNHGAVHVMYVSWPLRFREHKMIQSTTHAFGVIRHTFGHEHVEQIDEPNFNDLNPKTLVNQSLWRNFVCVP